MEQRPGLIIFHSPLPDPFLIGQAKRPPGRSRFPPYHDALFLHLAGVLRRSITALYFEFKSKGFHFCSGKGGFAQD
jgi:hypothetical protein